MQHRLKTIFLAITLLATVLTLFAAEEQVPSHLPTPGGVKIESWSPAWLSISPKVTESQVIDTCSKQHTINNAQQR